MKANHSLALVAPLLFTAIGCGGGASSGTGGSGATTTATSATSGTTATSATATGQTSATSSTSGAGGMGSCPVDNSGCAAVIAGYAPCGGDPKGDWMIQSHCQKPVQQMGGGNCPNGTLTAYGNGETGEVVIDATNVEFKPGTGTGFIQFHTPDSCLMGATCDQYKQTLMAQVPNICCNEVSSACDCSGEQTMPTPDTTAPYSVNGNSITYGGQTGDFCSNGTLSIHFVSGSQDITYVLVPKT